MATLLVNLVSAFGTSYVFERPLEMYPGQTRDLYVTLQNNNDENTITAVAELGQESEITKLTDGLDLFTVPYRTPVQVNLSIAIPSNAKIGDSYQTKLRFIPQATEGGGMGLVFVTGTNLDIVIIEKPVTAPKTEEVAEKAPITGVLVFIALAIVITAIVLILLVKKRKK